VSTAARNVWQLCAWQTVLPASHRSGLRLRFDSEVNPEVKAAFVRFGAWLRREYAFPLRVPVYVRATRRLRTLDGGTATGTFFEPLSHRDEPYIRLAAGDFEELLAERGRDNALCALLTCLAHELTHYFQWINALSLTDAGRERQASICARRILESYAQTVDHP